jgi:uncharacterized protein (TIGR02271 family)
MTNERYDVDLTTERFRQIYGRDVVASDGQRIGAAEELFLDPETDQPAWLGIGSELRGSRVLVPVRGAKTQQDRIMVPYDTEMAKSSPDASDDDISEETENALYEHYGAASRATASSGTPSSGQSMTRSEEELRVGIQRTEAGRARLRKWVETEPVQQDVTVSKERAKVERRPVDKTAASGAQIGEEEVEVTLQEERPVVAKETVAKEEVTLSKDVQSQTERVSDEVRKEVVEVEGDDVERQS